MRNFIEMEIENDSRGSYFVVFFTFVIFYWLSNKYKTMAISKPL